MGKQPPVPWPPHIHSERPVYHRKKESVMRVSTHEQWVVQQVVKHGKDVGFGNLICHLQSAWMIKLIEQGLGRETARQAVLHREPYPPAMHTDILECGSWDETGKRYQDE